MTVFLRFNSIHFMVTRAASDSFSVFPFGLAVGGVVARHSFVSGVLFE